MKYIRKTAGVEAFQVTLDRITQTINSNKGLPVWLVKALNKSPDEIYSVYCKDGREGSYLSQRLDCSNV